MTTEKLSIEEIREKTRAMLGLTDDDDLSDITEDYINAQAEALPMDEALDFPRTMYGTRVSYGHRPGYGPTYEFSCAAPGNGNWPDRPNEACGSYRWWAAHSHWNHYNEDRYCGGSGQPAFRRVARFVYRR